MWLLGALICPKLTLLSNLIRRPIPRHFHIGVGELHEQVALERPGYCFLDGKLNFVVRSVGHETLDVC